MSAISAVLQYATQRSGPYTLLVLARLCLAVSGGLAYLQAQTTATIQGTVSDPQGLTIAGAEVIVSSPVLAGPITVLSIKDGSYYVPALPPGTYSVRVKKAGFATGVYDGLTVTVNSVIAFAVKLSLGTMQQEVTVAAQQPLLDTEVSSSGSTILPQEIDEMPINGRNYLDLMQLVPGVTVHPQVDTGTDASVSILGERGGNISFLIDGLPNKNSVDGGAAAPFDQNSILEFQVLTTGYKAEFGRGSGGVVNVVSKSGTSQWHGLASAFHRNSALDSSDVSGTPTPFLLRWDADANLGGPVMKDRIFFFGSIERIRESRKLNFIFPPGVPDFLRLREESFDHRNQTFQTRSLLKLDEQLGAHRLTEQLSLTNGHVTNFLPLSQAISLPSTRIDTDSRYLMWGMHDTATLGNGSNPFLLNAYVQYRGEPWAERPAQPDASPATTLFNEFSGLNTGRLAGDLGQVEFGAGFTPLLLKQRYISSGANLGRIVKTHNLKFGWDFQQLSVNGTEAGNLLNQLFATTSDFSQFGPVNSGVYVLRQVAGLDAAANQIRLRNTYNGVFAQDDWKLARTLTLNLGLRWDYDSTFPNRVNFSPRLGIAWMPTRKTVVSASWGIFYDNFRLGLARDIPGFGGANLFRNQTISFPRLFYGNPTLVPVLGGICPSSTLTDAQVQAAHPVCPVGGAPVLGIDHLNSVVAPGHSPIPGNAAVNLANITALSGLTPQQFADAASAAVAEPPGFFFWGGFGNLSMNFLAPEIFGVPVTVDPAFKTPHTRAFHLGAQREITMNLVVNADYYHRDIRNILGVRTTNLAFEARMPGHTGELQPGTGSQPIFSYGPWYEGRYDAISVGIRKRMSKRFTLDTSYTWMNAVDNALNSSLVSEVQVGLGAGSLAVQGPTDSFVGIPSLVKDAINGKTNATGAFIASNGNPVPQAGKFYNGANLDVGPSDLALTHTLLVNGILSLPWQLQLSGIFRTQSGFHFSGSPPTPADVDGDGVLNGVDFTAGRNHFQAPPYYNVDMRLSKRFVIRERVQVEALCEFFNLLNRANAAAVEQFEMLPTPLGQPLQYLPGREGQVGLRIAF